MIEYLAHFISRVESTSLIHRPSRILTWLSVRGIRELTEQLIESISCFGGFLGLDCLYLLYGCVRKCLCHALLLVVFLTY